MRMSGWTRLAGLVLAAAAMTAQSQVTPELRAKIDAAAKQVLEQTGVPSASVGIVVGGKVAMTAAYGNARLQPELKATPEMKYPIGSISKQFTAAAILLLVEDGKVSLDDPVSRWFPELTRAKEVTIREILSHTSGYEDYAPQDYTIPLWVQPADPLKLVHEWAEKPLDFDPGTQWQYSNTNFVLAALIVEKAAGMPYWQFMKTRVLGPVGLDGVINLDTDRKAIEPLGYMRNALGPLRPAQMEGPGWYFGDASLGMTVGELLKWDISVMDETLLKKASYASMETEVELKSGAGTHYGLGVSVLTRNGRRIVEHSGEVGGFVAENIVFPDDKIAIAVLTNEEASSAASSIARAIAPMLLSPPAQAQEAPDAATAKAEEQARTILAGLQKGKIDRGLFTADCNFYFSKQAIGDFQSSLGSLGAVKELKQSSSELRGGMTFRAFSVRFSDSKAPTLNLTTYTMPDGKLEQFLIGP
jgi:CubicO group peptidase (beta-lactamase class C family)